MDLRPPLTPVFLTQREVAVLLCVPVPNVEDWWLTRSGPPWVKCGWHVRYEQKELLAWVEQRRHGEALLFATKNGNPISVSNYE